MFIWSCVQRRLHYLQQVMSRAGRGPDISLLLRRLTLASSSQEEYGVGSEQRHAHNRLHGGIGSGNVDSRLLASTSGGVRGVGTRHTDRKHTPLWSEPWPRLRSAARDLLLGNRVIRSGGRGVPITQSDHRNRVNGVGQRHSAPLPVALSVEQPERGRQRILQIIHRIAKIRKLYKRKKK